MIVKPIRLAIKNRRPISVRKRAGVLGRPLARANVVSDWFVDNPDRGDIGMIEEINIVDQNAALKICYLFSTPPRLSCFSGAFFFREFLRVSLDTVGCRVDAPVYVTFFMIIPLIPATGFTQKSRSPPPTCPGSTRTSTAYSKTTGLQNMRSRHFSNSCSTDPQPHSRLAKAYKSPTHESTER